MTKRSGKRIWLLGVLLFCCNAVVSCSQAGSITAIWCQTFGGTHFSSADRVAIAHNGNVFVGGTFMGEIDFDPGDATDLRESMERGSLDAFVSKFDCHGHFQRTASLSSTGKDEITSLIIDPGSTIYMTGLTGGEMVVRDPDGVVAQVVDAAYGDAMYGVFTEEMTINWLHIKEGYGAVKISDAAVHDGNLIFVGGEVLFPD
jgi:hypothetical protein